MNREEVPELKRNPCRRVFEWHGPGEKPPSTAQWSSGHQRVAARPSTTIFKILYGLTSYVIIFDKKSAEKQPCASSVESCQLNWLTIIKTTYHHPHFFFVPVSDIMSVVLSTLSHACCTRSHSLTSTPKAVIAYLTSHSSNLSASL
ncbi:hypothetical protein NPIL_252401 [Nephila pilipes]|uniref:Uncharacterized protein n=1 Tax=Nephila pilipes TaxID=299642 RepID=A0A8X6TTV7_NEPPI|nr:hypothetical protein NPIL_252401 [Nephila pilipes]